MVYRALRGRGTGKGGSLPRPMLCGVAIFCGAASGRNIRARDIHTPASIGAVARQLWRGTWRPSAKGQIYDDTQ